MDIQFAGEHLLPGQLGQFFIVLSFGSAFLATISYYFATVKDTLDDSWKRIARVGVLLNTVSVIGIGSCLFYIIYNHYFEYHYAWAHSSKALPVYYIISSFWEGQEGSFWLWTFWQSVLANILIWRARSWENSVMTTVMLSQTLLASMLLGVEILGTRIGSSPFILLRDAIDGPIFSRPDYLSLVPDGNGLNPLLQNYWMVIHPPTLFLGFASMIVPFAYAVGGLWEKRYKEWPSTALPWALFAVMILGTGIIMGSFWAYEALNFGGFWAWDPVENASIIPWITLIAAVHVILAYKSSGHSYFTATFLTIISFVLVLYASFLTRSGILGETSVHSFTDAGMFWHLVAYIMIFALLGIIIMWLRWKEMPITDKDEETYSREFWLFIGALVLSVSCLQVMVSTSIPVFNAILGTKLAPPTNVIEHYNKWQVPFAVVIAIISGFTQFLKYRTTDSKKFWKKILLYLVISIVVTAVFVYVAKVYTNLMYIVLTFAGIFSIVSNLELLWSALKGKWKLAGASVAHIGFALLLIGALVSAATSEVVSINNSGTIAVEGFDKVEKPRENLMLYQNEPIVMDNYTITYLGDSVDGANIYYRVNYKSIDRKTGKVKEEFDLYPNAQQNPKMGLVASPDTRHYLTYDIYTHATAAPQIKKEEHHEPHEGHTEDEEYDTPITSEVSPGDTVNYSQGFIVVKAVNRNATVESMPLSPTDIAVRMELEIVTGGKTYEAKPVYVIKNGNKFDLGTTLEEAGLKLRFSNIYPERNKLELTILQKPMAPKKWIVLKAIKFPYINLFWGGTIIMVIGFLLSIFRRQKELKTAR